MWMSYVESGYIVLQMLQLILLACIPVVQSGDHVCVFARRPDPSRGYILRWSLPKDEACKCDRVTGTVTVSTGGCAPRQTIDPDALLFMDEEVLHSITYTAHTKQDVVNMFGRHIDHCSSSSTVNFTTTTDEDQTTDLILVFAENHTCYMGPNYAMTTLDPCNCTLLKYDMEDDNGVKVEHNQTNIRKMLHIICPATGIEPSTSAQKTTDQETTTQQRTDADTTEQITSTKMTTRDATTTQASTKQESLANKPTTDITPTTYSATGNGLVPPECLQCICTVLSGCKMPDPYGLGANLYGLGDNTAGTAYYNDAKLDQSWPEDLTLGFEDCKLDFQCSEQVVISYMERSEASIKSTYGVSQLTCEQFAKVHKGLAYNAIDFIPDTSDLDAFWNDVLICMS